MGISFKITKTSVKGCNNENGVTATVEALSALIASGNPLFKNGALWTPHRPIHPEKSEGGIPFQLETSFKAAGDQPQAIKILVEGIEKMNGHKYF